MTRKKELPVGIEDFKVLIDNNYYYVDKTKLLCELVRNIGKVNLFTRPRRFGKTLTLSMIQYFFEKQPEDNVYLFNGLHIAEAGEEYAKYQGQYPVVTLSLKGMKTNTFEEALAQFGWMISRECQRHQEILHSDLVTEGNRAVFRRLLNNEASQQDYCISVQLLTSSLMQIHGKKAIVLIDEYDVPLENSHFRGFYDQMVGFIRSVFDNALKTNNSLEMAVLTGCLRVSKESLFTGLNNLQINSIQSGMFEECFGFTESEVKAMTDYYDLSDKYPIIKEWYDGYCFGETEIYNPWSVLNYMQDVTAKPNAIPMPYWSNTSSNQIIRQLVIDSSPNTRDTIETLINGGSVVAPIHEDIVYADIDVNEESIWSFLLFTGYLKQVGVADEEDDYMLRMVIPNREVKTIYRRHIRKWFKDRTKAVSRDDLLQALLSEDVDTANRIVGTWLNETISFFDEKEQYYHGFLAGLLSGFDNYRLKSNRETGDGRTDLLLMERYSRDLAIVIEVKDVDTKKNETLELMADQAIRQIEEKHYEEEPLHEGYKKILKYGFAFMGKNCLIKQG